MSEEKALELAVELERLAERARSNSRAYDGGGWDMKADAYEHAAEMVRERLAGSSARESTRGAFRENLIPRAPNTTEESDGT